MADTTNTPTSVSVRSPNEVLAKIKIRHGSSTDFTKNKVVLLDAEPVYETDTKRIKIGDGTTEYSSLEYLHNLVKTVSLSGQTLTINYEDGTSSKFTTQDNDYRVTQNYSTVNGYYPLLASAVSGVSETTSRGTTTTILNNSIYINPSSGSINSNYLNIKNEISVNDGDINVYNGNIYSLYDIYSDYGNIYTMTGDIVTGEGNIEAMEGHIHAGYYIQSEEYVQTPDIYVDKKTYTGIYGTANKFANAAFFFASVKPTSFYMGWHVKYTISATVPNQNNYNGFFEVDVYGAQTYRSVYKCFNAHANTSYRSLYNHTLYTLTETGYNAGYGHLLGIDLTGSSNPSSSSYPRTFTIKILECDNCEVTMYDSMKLYSAVTGNGTTNYNGYANFNGYDNGLQELGDDNAYDKTVIGSAKVYAGANGIYGYNLIMQDTTGSWQSFVLSSSTSSSKSKNTAAFIPSNIYYYSGSSSASSGKTVSNNTLYEVYPAINMNYSTNANSKLTQSKSVYLVGTMSDGAFYLANTWWSQTLPTSDDGYVYIYLGEATSSSAMTLMSEHPMFCFKNGSLQRYTYSSEYARKLADPAGSSTQPIYINNDGNPTGIDYTIEKSVPKDAIFTDQNVSQIYDTEANIVYPLFSNSSSDGTRGTYFNTDFMYYPGSNQIVLNNVAATECVSIGNGTDGSLMINDEDGNYSIITLADNYENMDNRLYIPDKSGNFVIGATDSDNASNAISQEKYYLQSKESSSLWLGNYNNNSNVTVVEGLHGGELNSSGFTEGWSIDTTGNATFNSQVTAEAFSGSFDPVCFTNVCPESEINFNLVVMVENDKSLRDIAYIGANNDILISNRWGSSKNEGIARLILGNRVQKGSNENSTGSIRLYGSNTGYTDIITTSSASSYTITLPAKTGTVALTSDLSSYVPLNNTTKIIASDASSYDVSMTVASDWTDTSISLTALETGTYIIQISTAFGTASSSLDSCTDIFSGVMSIVKGTQTSDSKDEIVLHHYGSTYDKFIYTRTCGGKLQVCSDSKITASYYRFKIKRFM